MIYITTYSPSDSSQARDHELGRELLDFGLTKEYGLELKNQTVAKGEHQKPYFPEHPGIHFNISHTKGMVVCAIHEEEIGVDVELIRPFSSGLAGKIFTGEEKAALKSQESRGTHLGNMCFFRYWTLKESYVKATGQGLSVPLRNVGFLLDRNNRVERGPDGYRFHQRCLWNQYMLTVCMKDKERKTMTYEILFEEMKQIFGKADVSGIKDHLAFQFNVTGEAEGTFYAEVADGVLHVEPYDYRDRDALFTVSGEVLLKIATGKMDPVSAFATGKLKVDGSIEKALMIQQLMKK